MIPRYLDAVKLVMVLLAVSPMSIASTYPGLATIDNGLVRFQFRADNAAFWSANLGGLEFLDTIEDGKHTIGSFGIVDNTNNDPLDMLYSINQPKGGGGLAITPVQPKNYGMSVAFSGHTNFYPFERTPYTLTYEYKYTLMPGSTVLRMDTTVTSNININDLWLFWTVNPDQGKSLASVISDPAKTHMDVFNVPTDLGSSIAAAGWIEYGLHTPAMIMGGSQAGTLAGAMGSERLSLTPENVVDFFTSPRGNFDGAGKSSNSSLDLGLRYDFTAGTAMTWTTYMALGDTLTEAVDQFAKTQSPLASTVPEPASLVLLVIGAGAIGVKALRRRH